MLECDRINISEGTDVDKTDRSKECMFYRYWYFLNKNLKYGQCLCDGCYYILQRSTDLEILLLLMLEKMHIGFIFQT